MMLGLVVLGAWSPVRAGTDIGMSEVNCGRAAWILMSQPSGLSGSPLLLSECQSVAEMRILGVSAFVLAVVCLLTVRWLVVRSRQGAESSTSAVDGGPDVYGFLAHLLVFVVPVVGAAVVAVAVPRSASRRNAFGALDMQVLLLVPVAAELAVVWMTHGPSRMAYFAQIAGFLVLVGGVASMLMAVRCLMLGTRATWWSPTVSLLNER